MWPGPKRVQLSNALRRAYFPWHLSKKEKPQYTHKCDSLQWIYSFCSTFILNTSISASCEDNIRLRSSSLIISSAVIKKEKQQAQRFASIGIKRESYWKLLLLPIDLGRNLINPHEQYPFARLNWFHFGEKLTRHISTNTSWQLSSTVLEG